MRYLLYFVFVIGVLVGLSSCAYDNPPPIEIPPGVSFMDQVIPIFEASCNSVGCHAQGGIAPILTAERAYTELIQGFSHTGVPYVIVEDPDGSSLMHELDSGDMPPAGNLPAIEIEIVRQWMAEGAENN